MGTPRTYDPKRKSEVFDTLRREILAARLKVTLDQQLKRTSSPTVQRLAQMKLPPIIVPRYEPIRAGAEQATTRNSAGSYYSEDESVEVAEHPRHAAR